MEGNHTIWIEKYRPRRLDDIVGQNDIVVRLKSYVKTGNLPHLLFAGSAGVGKTTAAVALAREFFGDSWQTNFREMNASDERGIDVVRTQIKEFARTSPLGDAQFKILFLDEADALTTDAQAALRRTMETYARTCRFILSCNYSSKIIDPIQSRCAIYRFRPLDREAVIEEIRRIAAAEGLTLTEGALDAIVYVAAGDMRKAINALQGAAIISPEIDEKMIYAITATARPDEIDELLDLSIGGRFDEAEKALSDLTRVRGIAPNEILNQCYRALVQRDIDRALKVKLIDAIGEADFRLSEGANSDIQMEALIARFVLAAAEHR
ncbi:MAG: replication factor C small subunit [Methanoculleus sp.]|jgi:replication factor C small subunit|nr:replication factor C small subunit [Methanoculleus sp.]MBP8676626.1 replication factor C small subunit [Methanoculleus sp.]HOB07538.1 replication factor C small subunit [Methanoculleus sp.]HOD85831.1 replication factor C small subunit [Methanoculleus sp.]HRD25956.1 replication factor C small subunit [Methanoculleus sp.]